MENEKKISERQAAKILEVDPATLLHWRRKGIISPTIFFEKRYATGHIRFFYNVKLLEAWKSTINQA
jgi:DNA-binding transcriptional MerR regulator